MLALDHKLKLDTAAIRSPNLCDRFEDVDLQRIGVECAAGYARDVQSRSQWMERNEAGMDLALQITKEKTFPWPGCANVAFPLVTIAAQQFHARAYPAIVAGPELVKYTVFGPDPAGADAARGERISEHMSWQLLYEDRAWEDQTDKGLLNLSIVGANFKKSYYSASLGHNVSELVLAKDFVLDYWAKSVEECPRKTHKTPLSRNEVHERVMRGIFRDCLEEGWYKGGPPTSPRSTEQVGQDNRQGITPPQLDDTTFLQFREQHVNMDLDGDGYAEPYIITFEETSQWVARIVTRFDSEAVVERVASGSNKGAVIRITAMEYFTKYSFIPSPDGGIYDIGFGVFLGPLNEAVNSLVNMLLDAGTMQTTGGGFLGRGAKIRGGTYTVAPFEWKRVDSTGDDLRKSIVPHQFNEPSQVLFSLLSLLINYTSRISGTTDIMVGENPGQNTPAQTTQTMVEMGQKIYGAIFKRVWRASKEEFAKLFQLNAMFLPLDVPQVGGATRLDYAQTKPERIAPVADPSAASETMQMQRALTVKQAAMQTPGYDRDLVERRFLKALKVEDIDQVFPGTKGSPPPEDPKVQVAKLKIQGEMQMQQGELQFRMSELVANLQVQRELNNAKIVELMASAQESAANAQSESAYAQVALINAQISQAQHEGNRLDAQVDAMLKALKIQTDKELGLKQIAAKPAKATK